MKTQGNPKCGREQNSRNDKWLTLAGLTTNWSLSFPGKRDLQCHKVTGVSFQKGTFHRSTLAYAAWAGSIAHGGRVFGHLTGPAPSRRKLCKMFLLEIRITSFPPQQEFLTKLGFEVHLGFIPTKSIFLKVI